VQARPYLLELVSRLEQEDPEKRAALESLYLYLGIGYLVEYSEDGGNEALTEAINWLKRLNDEFPESSFALNANLYMADAHRGLQQFEEAATIYEKLLKPPFESQLSSDQRLESLKKLTQALYIARNWERGLPWFEQFLNEARSQEDRAAAAAALLEGNIKLGNYDEALRYLRFLVGESPARYQLQLNVALIDAGDKLAEKKRFAEAMLMYRMVLTVEEIKEWQYQHLLNLQNQLDRLRLTTTDASNERAIELETQIFNTEAQIEALEDVDYTAALRVRIARNYLQTKREWEAYFAYGDVLQDYPDHPNQEDFVYASFTTATQIEDTDAVIKYGELYLDNPDYRRYTNDVVVKLLEYYRKQRNYEEFFYLAKNFVTENPDTEYAASVVFLMGSTYTQLDRFAEMVRQFQEWEKAYPNTKMDPGLFYWTGLGMILEGQYSEAWEYFNRILQDYPDNVYAEDSLYRRGICYMGIEDYEGAKRDFSQFVRKYPETNLRGEVEFFLGEIESALGNMNPAIKHYSNVEKYTDNIAFIQNAYFQMGVLLEANAQYERMASMYETFIEKFADSAELTGIIYELGRAYELNLEPHRTLNLYREAIAEYGDDPFTYGLDQILQAYPEIFYRTRDLVDQNLNFLTKLTNERAFRELLAARRQALFDYLADKPLIRENIKRDLYDAEFRRELVEDTSPLQERLAMFQDLKAKFPTETPEETFARLYHKAREEGEETLGLRLQYGLAQLGEDVDPDRVFSEDDFFAASPVVLVWMGKRILAYDRQTAREAFQLVLDDHADSAEVFDALLALGDLAAAEGDYGAAIGYYDEIEAEFPRDDRLVEALMAKADALNARGDRADARDTYKMIVDTRKWRGAAHAEALYKIGLSYLNQGELIQAQAYFERVYIGYPLFSEWAARAYLESGRTLQQLGRRDDARQTYDEFLADESYRETEVYSQIKQARSAL